MKWKGDATDDGRYAIDSEHVHGEPKVYYVMIRAAPGQGHRGSSWKYGQLGPFLTKREARAAAKEYDHSIVLEKNKE
jgi:hypothetical protein